jgi:hypothetical protein
MANATGEAKSGPLRLGFDSSVQLLFRGSAISSDGGLLLHRELDDALGLTDLASGLLADHRTGKNGRHTFIGLLRQSVFSRLAGYEDVNDADRLCRDPVMRQLIGGRAVKSGAASASAMGRFETATLTQAENLAALADLSELSMSRPMTLDGRWAWTASIQWPERSARAAKFSAWVRVAVSNRPMALADAAPLFTARPPINWRMTGSRQRRSASLTSS